MCIGTQEQGSPLLDQNLLYNGFSLSSLKKFHFLFIVQKHYSNELAINMSLCVFVCFTLLGDHK